MSHTAQNILGLILLAVLFIATRYGIGWQMKKSTRRVIEELKAHGAISPATAVPLNWAKPNWLKFGIRDFKPGALKSMVASGLVSQTDEGLFFMAGEIAEKKR